MSHDALKQVDFLFGLGVGEFGAVLRVGGERDGFRVSLGEVEALPEFLGEERHGGMQEAQGGLEGGGGVGPAGGAHLFQLEIPIAEFVPEELPELLGELDRKSTRLNSSHLGISYAVFCL